MPDCICVEYGSAYQLVESAVGLIRSFQLVIFRNLFKRKFCLKAISTMAFGSATGLNVRQAKRAAVKPVDDPPFTVSTLRKAIPPHCFERSLVKSFGHLFVDLAILAVLYSLSQRIDGLDIAQGAKWALWAGYWALAGSVGTGVWVIA